MLKREKMLETIYETDETILVEVTEEDESSKAMEKPSRLSYYICLCMIIGCFLALGLLIAISLNPFLLTKNLAEKTSIQSADPRSLSIDLVQRLEIFSKQINEQLDLPSDTITIFPEKISDLPRENQSELFWIYSYLNYPRKCDRKNECKERFHSKLRSSSTKLENLFSTIDLQINQCHFIDNSTRAILVSVLSTRMVNQSISEYDRLYCKNTHPNTFLTKVLEHDQQKSIDFLDRNSSPINSLHCSNDLPTHILLVENSY